VAQGGLGGPCVAWECAVEVLSAEWGREGRSSNVSEIRTTVLYCVLC
jgi:hypothetical protein